MFIKTNFQNSGFDVGQSSTIISWASVKYFQEKLCADMKDLIFTVKVIVVAECFSAVYL